MATEYTIYLVNESSSTQVFWCFLERPKELVNDPNVFANSSTNLAVGSFQPGVNTFTIPVQYVVGAGASNNAVGLNILVNSSVTNKADLTNTWEVDYVTVPPKQGPTMQKLGTPSPDNTIAIQSNAFDQAKNEAAGWFSSMSFGIQTNQGFMGMSWSPNPQKTRTLTPKLNFYVAVGAYESNTLASWSEVSNNSIEISVPSSFKYNATTVTYTSTGGWVVTPGKPPTILAANSLSSLTRSHQFISKAHADLVALAQLSPSNPILSSSSSQTDKILKVVWNVSDLDDSDVDTSLITLSGTLTVTTALAAAFTAFVLSGVYFTITGGATGATTFNFTYNGTLSVQAVKALFVAGANITLT